jgi:hypothetical protein
MLCMYVWMINCRFRLFKDVFQLLSCVMLHGRVICEKLIGKDVEGNDLDLS